MIQHRLGGVRRRSCSHHPETPDAVSSADFAFDQPLKGVPRSTGERAASSCVPSARARQPSAGCYGRSAPGCRRARARRSSPHIVQRPGFGVRLWSAQERLCKWETRTRSSEQENREDASSFLAQRDGAARQWLLLIIGGSATNCR
jgi:hypothetical protein